MAEYVVAWITKKKASVDKESLGVRSYEVFKGENYGKNRESAVAKYKSLLKDSKTISVNLCKVLESELINPIAKSENKKE